MDVVQRYLLLALRLGRHIDGFVDFYYGPPELAERVKAEAPAPPAALAAEGQELAGILSTLADPRRERWFAAQLEGLVTVAQRLDGEPIPYEDEVRRCYGVDLDPATEDELAGAHERLDGLLPGPGPLRERYHSWRHEHDVPADALLPALEALTVELRRRTDALFGLPEGEAASFELATNEPWSGFNYYLGKRRSRIAINTDFPVRAELLPFLVSHEVYPGHHTQFALREALLVDARGCLEETIAPVGAPQALLDEGIANAGLDILGDDAEPACAEILAGFGVGYDVELVRRVREAEEPMRRVGDAAAHLIHVQGRGVDETRDFVARWSMVPDDEAEKTIEFVTHPTWRSYIAVYETGWRLVESWTEGDPARHRRLLTEQFTPADLLQKQE